MTFPWILPLRAVQGLLAFIVLGTAAYGKQERS